MPITGKSGSPWRRDDQVMALACGSASTRRTRRPFLAKAAARLTEIVVLPAPPFWFSTPMIIASPRKRRLAPEPFWHCTMLHDDADSSKGKVALAVWRLAGWGKVL